MGFSMMSKPAFIFDGRNLLNHEELREIGFEVYGIGKSQIASPKGSYSFSSKGKQSSAAAMTKEIIEVAAKTKGKDVVRAKEEQHSGLFLPSMATQKKERRGKGR